MLHPDLKLEGGRRIGESTSLIFFVRMTEIFKILLLKRVILNKELYAYSLGLVV